MHTCLPSKDVFSHNNISSDNAHKKMHTPFANIILIIKCFTFSSWFLFITCIIKSFHSICPVAQSSHYHKFSHFLQLSIIDYMYILVYLYFSHKSKAHIPPMYKCRTTQTSVFIFDKQVSTLYNNLYFRSSPK